MSFCTAECFHEEVNIKLEDAEPGESTNAYKSALPLRWNSSPRVPRVVNIKDDRLKTKDETATVGLRGILSNICRSAQDILRLYMQSGIVFAAATFAVVMIIFVALLYSQVGGLLDELCKFRICQILAQLRGDTS